MTATLLTICLLYLLALRKDGRRDRCVPKIIQWYRTDIEGVE